MRARLNSCPTTFFFRHFNHLIFLPLLTNKRDRGHLLANKASFYHFRQRKKARLLANQLLLLPPPLMKVSEATGQPAPTSATPTNERMQGHLLANRLLCLPILPNERERGHLLAKQLLLLPLPLMKEREVTFWPTNSFFCHFYLMIESETTFAQQFSSSATSF